VRLGHRGPRGSSDHTARDCTRPSPGGDGRAPRASTNGWF